MKVHVCFSDSLLTQSKHPLWDLETSRYSKQNLWNFPPFHRESVILFSSNSDPFYLFWLLLFFSKCRKFSTSSYLALDFYLYQDLLLIAFLCLTHLFYWSLSLTLISQFSTFQIVSCTFPMSPLIHFGLELPITVLGNQLFALNSLFLLMGPPLLINLQA